MKHGGFRAVRRALRVAGHHQPVRPWPLALALVALLALVPGLAEAQVTRTSSPSRVKAAFLRNFAHYVTWPPDAFTEAQSPWCIGILGPDPFGGVLEHSLAGRMEQGRAFSVVRADDLEGLPACHIVYIAYPDAARRRAALRAFGGRAVLTVGEAPAFLFEGGIIQLTVEEHVRMRVNLDQARAAKLAIPTKMLEVSVAVLDHGTLRQVR